MMAAWLGLMLACQHLMAVTVTITNGVTGSGLILGTDIYEIGARVTLRAAPQLDWKFDHWDGVPAGMITNNPVVFEAAIGIRPQAVFVPAVGSGKFNGGTVVAWGWNSVGQSDVPKAATNVISIAAGAYHTVALRNDGLLLAWGSMGSSGPGQVFYSNYVQGAVSVSALNYRKDNGDVFGFYGSPAVLSQAAATKTQFLGDNVAVLDDGSIKILNGFKEPPVKVSDIIQSDTSYAHQWGLAVRKDGSVYGWGEDGFGGWKIPSNISNIVQVSAGQDPALVIRNDGLILAWGSGATSVPNQSSGAISISAGNQHAVAALRDGTVLAWGQGQYQSTEIPVGLKGVMQVAAGSYHCAALSVNGIQCSGGIDDYYSVELGSELLIQPIIYAADRFQWYKDSAALVGETNVSINIKNVSSKDGGSYQLLVSSATESLLTRPSIVRILPVGTPRIMVDGVDVPASARQGDSAVVSLTTSFGNGQIFYTLDGTVPSFDSRRYLGPFKVTNSVVVRAYALSGDFTQEASNESVSIQIVPTYALNTAVNGGGTVKRSPSLVLYQEDTVVAVTAVPETGWRFARWQGDLTGAFPDRNVAMGRNKSIRAVFEAIPQFNLTVLSQGGTATGAGTYYQSAAVGLTASPAVGWTFLGWTGDYVGTESSFTWAVEGPAVFVANFGTTVSNLATGSGHVVLEPNQPVYSYGSQVKVIPVPEPGNYLALWGEAGAGQPSTEWTLTVTNTQPRVTALFRALAADKVLLSCQSSAGGRVIQTSASGLYPKGTLVTLTAVADSGYEFLGWSGASSGSVNPLSLTLDTSKTVRAEFRRTGVVSYPLALTVSGPGTVRRVPDLGAYESGTEVELVAEPTSGAVFGGWSGALSSSQRRVRLTISGAVSVGANFKSVYPVVTETWGEGQVLLSPPDANYVEGFSVALTAKPAEGWGFVQWSGDIGTTDQESALTVDAPKRVVAEFARLGTLTLKSIGQGAIAKTPDAASYLPGTAVSLKATPAAGWKFVRWSGGASGSNADLAVVVGRTEAIVAEFGDGEAPKLALTEPVSGSVTDERFAMKGSVSDNLRLASATWTWNGALQGAVPMGDGVFSIDGLTLNPGTNQIVMDALDAAGNVTRVERVVVWTPVRSLVVKAAAEVQEGQRLVFPVTIDSPGDVAGLTFQLAYDPVCLTDPQWEWGALVGQSVNTLNTATNGQVWATFSMPGQALPLGVQAIAVVSFRARSVPEVREVDLKSSIRSVSGLQGNALSLGNGAISGKGRIKPRRLKADNNANQRLDIGDAVVVARLQVGLEETRAWDVGLNDLNSSGSLDNGDVVKVLRTVVALDPQPSPGSEGKRLASALGLAKVLVNTNDVIAIDLLDGPKATVGQPYRVAVRLNRVKGSLSGLSFALKYPASLTLIDKQVGALVPGDALPFWNESAGQVSLAAIRSTAWAGATGVAAVLTFVPSAGFSAQAEWPLKLEQVEITGSGFDVRPVDPVTVAIQSGGGTVDNRPQLTLEPPKADGTLGLEIRAPQGATVAVETTSDLSTWTETQRITGQGAGSPVKITLQPDPNVQTKFWRVRVR